MFAEQDGLCAICRQKGGQKGIGVDHDHETDAVRGLLCTRCNIGIGQLKHSIQLLAAAIQYLLRSQQVILSPHEQASVREVAHSYNIDGDPEVLVDDALQAICSGQADSAAYAVGRAAGIDFIGDFIWGKDRRHIVRADQARALIAQAKQDQTYEGPIPEDDAKAVEEANALVELATDAWNDMVRGPEVEAILRLAAQFESENGDAPPEAEVVAEEEPKVSIRPDADPEKPVQDAKPELVEVASAAFRTDDLDELAKIEPWEGYSDERVGDILNGINAAIETYELEELYELLRNIWAFESSKRARKTVLDAIEDVHTQITEAQRAEGQTPYAPPNQIERSQEEPSSASAGEVEAPTEDDEVEPGAADEDAGDEGGEGDGEEVPAPDREREPDAEPEPEPEAPEPPSQEPVPEAEPVGEAPAEWSVEVVPETAQATEKIYQQLVADSEEEIRRQRMHIPEPPSEVAPEVPWDWTKLSDAELQRLHSAFHGFAYYVDYRLSRENRIALACKQAADELSRILLVAAAKYDEKGKEVRVTFLEAEIEADENVKAWRHRQRRHEAFASALRSEREGYFKLLEGLSRHESMRQNEWQRAGSKPGSILRRSSGK